MIRMKTLIVALLAMPLLAACAAGPDLTMTSRMASKGDAFQQALHREYLALARAEADEGDTDDAVYFNNRAMAAANGKDKGPQALKARKIKGDAKWELEAARQALRAALGTGGMKNKPNTAAKAQAMFDCWMQEQEEGDQPKHIAACRDPFDTALKKLEERPRMMAKPMKKKMKKKKIDTKFVVYFDHNSAALSPAGMKTVVDVRRLPSRKTVVVSGHTDTSGSRAYNEKLAEKRANVVAGALKASGVKAYKIFVEAFGEDDPAMVTEDNVRETLNRRVNVTVQ